MFASVTISTKLPRGSSAWYHIDFATTHPVVLAQSFLVSIVLFVAAIKLLQRQISYVANNTQGTKKETPIIIKPRSVRNLQIKFLTVFWLLRFAFWMAGPYFYAAFASKTINGQPMPVKTISHISLTGYAAIALLGPLAGKISQSYGNRIATIVGMLSYGLGSLSVASNSLPILFLGRACAGVGQSILSNAPESWFIAEIKQKDKDPNENFLGETFGIAYSMDSIVAIAAGQLAQWAAASRGPTGPFTYAPWFLLVGSIGVLLSWAESTTMTGPSSQGTSSTRSDTSIQDTLRIILADPKIICLGVVQSLFEAAMYIFVIAWAPLMQQTIQVSIGNSVATPYGKIFSCFMAACMLGSTLFTIMIKLVRLERVMTILLATASSALASSLLSMSNNSNPLALFRLFFCFLAFEACVGLYFPSIGTIRATILPESHRSVIMTLFAVPLNALVVTCFLLLDELGHNGGLAVAAAAVGVATMAMVWLDRQSQLERRKHAREQFQKVAHKVMLMNTICTEFTARLGANGQMYMVDGRFSRQESRSSFASLNAPMS